jgi:hypothetical protein
MICMALRNSLMTRLQGCGVVHKTLIVGEATATTSPWQPPSLLMAWSPHIPSPPLTHPITYSCSKMTSLMRWLCWPEHVLCHAYCSLSKMDLRTGIGMFLCKLKDCVTVMSNNIFITRELRCQLNPMSKMAAIKKDISRDSDSSNYI